MNWDGLCCRQPTVEALNSDPEDPHCVQIHRQARPSLKKRESERRHLPFLCPLGLVTVVFVRVLKGADLPADGAKRAPLEAGLLFSDAVDFSEDGTSQQDVDPRVQDLIAGGHSDTRHHQASVSVFVSE